MFTGLIQEIGVVREKRTAVKSSSLKIEAGLCRELKKGDSIAVNGVCLTAAAIEANGFRADIMPETWQASNLAFLKPGDRVNLEPALKLGERFGGHLVSGHVDGMGRVSHIYPQQNAVNFKIQFSQQLAKLLAKKGSVAINGVSLTIQDLADLEMTIALIPHTFSGTNFSEIRAGALVNIEVDPMARQLLAIVGSGAAGIDQAFLAEHGYL